MAFSRSKSRFLVAALALVAAACSGDDYEPGVPARITMDTTAFTFTALGEERQFTATVVDGGGNPATGTVAWSTTNPSILRVDQEGNATAMGPGDATMMVTAGTISTNVDISVAPEAAVIIPVLGNWQSGPASQPLRTAMGVRVGDASGYSVEGAIVEFTTASAGASFAVSRDTTDEFGYAEATMTLGSALGDYTAAATVLGTAHSVTFNALAEVPPTFDIEVVFVSGSPTASQAAAFRSAEMRWESIITGDLPDDFADLPAWSCGNSPALNRAIDDVIIFVDLSEIDGPGGILGGAGICFLHDVGLLPAIGRITFDGADVGTMESEGIFEGVALHEMGHVLGIGSIWEERGLLAEPSWSGGLDPHFTGLEALTAFDLIGGLGYPNNKVPVENQGGPGTADAHWRESVLDNELMTGFIAAGPNPLSLLTIASLDDLGYEVDVDQADDYEILLAMRGPSAVRKFKLGNDILKGQIKIINKQGKIVGTYRK